MARLAERFTLLLKPSTSFNLHLTASAYNFSWYYDGHCLHLPVTTSPPTVAVIVEEGKWLRASCRGEGLSKEEFEEVIRHRLGVDEDLSEFHSMALDDPLLWAVPRRLRGMRLRASSAWASFIAALCQQNASFRQGWSMVHRVLKELGSWVEVNGRPIPLPPPPIKVASAGLDGLKRMGLGFRSSALFNAACKLVERGLDEPSTSELKRLIEVRGVGSYTVRVAQLFSARLYEEPPVDRWLTKVAAEAYHVAFRGIKEAENFIKARWRRWAGLFAFFTTIVTDAEPGAAALERVRKGLLEPSPLASKPTPMTLWRYF